MGSSTTEFGEDEFRSLARAVALEGGETILWESALSETLVKKWAFSRKRTPERVGLFEGCLLFSRPVHLMEHYGDTRLGRILKAEWRLYSEIWLRNDGEVVHTQFHDGQRFVIENQYDLTPIDRFRDPPTIATVGELLSADFMWKRGSVVGSSTSPFVEWEIHRRRTGEPWSIREPLVDMMEQIHARSSRVVVTRLLSRALD